MKNFRLLRNLFLIALFFPILVSGQDWQNICSPGITLYQQSSNLAGIRFTNVEPMGNQDTLFTTFSAWGYDIMNYRTFFGSILGKSILKTHDGWFVCFNIFPSDTFYKVSLNTRAVPGDKWIIYRKKFNPNLLVEAEVTAQATDTILGSVDSVRIFTLQAKDSSGNNLANSINGKQIILSKHYGLVKTRDFNNFMGTDEYLLAGKSTPQIGMQEITGKEIFNFQAGDVFHYTGSYAKASGPDITRYTWKETREILVSGPIPGGYHYQVKQCILKSYTAPKIDTTYSSEVSDQIYMYNLYTEDPYFRMPLEELQSQYSPIDNNFYSFSRSVRENGRQQKNVVSCGYYCNQYGCFSGNGYGCFPDDISLVDGLGIVHFHQVKINDDDAPNASFPYPLEVSYDQVYYKKDTITHGTPVVIVFHPDGYRVNPSNAALYYRDDAGRINSFRVDAARALTGKDSVFITFPTIRPVAGSNCMDTAGGSLLGRNIIMRNLGKYQFLNNNRDTLTLNSAATYGGFWKFCSLLGGSPIIATVASVGVQEVFGVFDTVKIISFQAYGMTGQPIPHKINGKTISLSNSFGFLNVFDFTLAPDSLVFYNLAGISSPALGLQDLTWNRIYNFDTGDCFHYKKYHIEPGPSIDSVETKTMLTILDKTIHPDGDSITYHAGRCALITHHLPNGSYILPGIKDTIAITFSSGSFPYPGWSQRQPDEFYPYPGAEGELCDHFMMVDPSEYNGRQLRESLMPAFSRSSQNCWIPADGLSPGTYRYADGLGLVLHEPGDPSLPGSYQEKLVWYLKGTETWGTPVAESCSSLLDQEEIAGTVGIVVKINPSPVGTFAIVTVDNLVPFKQCEFVLYNLMGKAVVSTVLMNRQTIIPRTNIRSGLYTWKVITPSGPFSGKIIFN